jgi:methyltransferase family protein
VTAGDSDFLLISEDNDAENIIAALMAAAAAGAISDMTTARAWTGAEFKAVGEKASVDGSGRDRKKSLHASVCVGKGVKIDLALIDGMHTFDYVLVDFFLTDKLMRPSGIIMMDDYSWPAIYKVCRYIAANLPYRFIGPLVEERPSVRQRIARRVASVYPFSKISKDEYRHRMR